MSYTKRSWRVLKLLDGAEIRDEISIIADVHCGQFTSNKGTKKINKEECYANAHLISAAPELLEACKKARDYLVKYHANGDIYADGIMAMQDCSVAIAKAEGK